MKTRLVILILSIPAFAVAQDKIKPTDFVNPIIGTAPLEDLSLYGGPNYNPDPKDMGFSGLVYPGASLPHGLVKLSPLTEVIYSDAYTDWTHGSGYYYPDNTLVGFAHTNKGHWSKGNIPFIPTVGKLLILPGTAKKPEDGFRSRFSHYRESAGAGYYSVVLEDYNILVELTATRCVGFHKYTFPKTEEGHVIIDLGHAIENIDTAYVEVMDDRHIRGFQNSVYFFAEFSKPFKSFGTWKGEKINPLTRSAYGNNIGVYIDYQTFESEEMTIKVGLSYVNMDKARINLEADARQLDFEKARINAGRIWNEKLSTIEIQGGTIEQKTNFYTSLYRAMLWPPVISDVDGQYRYRKNLYFSDHDYYDAPPLWDAFRNHMPLLTLLEPDVKLNILRSFLERAEINGWMDTQFQGNHAASVFASSILAGLDDFDVEKAYYYLKKNQTDPAGPVQYLDDYNNLGYIATVDPPPDDYRSHPHRSSVAKTLEYSYDSYCMSILADILEKDEDKKLFLKQSNYYKNVFDTSTGFMRGKKPDGTWIEPFDPEVPRFTYVYREANAWQSTWFVPHDVKGLIELMGGREVFSEKLDEFFSTPYEPQWTLIDIAGMIGQYAHSNQPDHQVPYFYNYSGEPWKTQEIVREILDKMYRGMVYTGMDDCGEMASWYVWSAMGFYPVNPASLIYPVGSPIFDRVTIHLSKDHFKGRKFVLKALNVSNQDKYIQSAELNGKPFNNTWISFKNIAAGDTLVLNMGSEPDKSWGRSDENAPPSHYVELIHK